MMKNSFKGLVLLFFLSLHGFAAVKVGADRLFEEKYKELLTGKSIGLITNHSAVNSDLKSTFELLKNYSGKSHLKAVFAPEHGFYGSGYAYEDVEDHYLETTPIYGLFGATRRPTKDMLDGIDLL